MKYTLKVSFNKKTNTYFIRLPKKLLSDLKWKTGDNIEFIDNKDGTWILKRV